MRMADKDSGIPGVRVVDERFRVGCVQVMDESCGVCGVWVVDKSR